ncbi:hypothetical protein [Priestia aryabhattai]|uniref:hypothetical protein n=1 Tax=Priestia aryabhattai TaxID=412384 RepID=UPI003D2A7595
MAITYLNKRENLDVLPLELRKVYELLEVDAGGVIIESFITSNGFGFLGGREQETELMLALVHNKYIKKLTIRLIKFKAQRQGNCTKLMELLIQHGHKEGYELIELESVDSEGMEAFAKKNNFEQEVLHPVLQKAFGTKYSGNWIKKI